MVRELEVELGRHDRTRGLQQRLHIVHDAVDQAAGVGGRHTVAHDRLLRRVGARNAIFGVLRQVLAHQLARPAGDREKDVFQPDDLTHPDGMAGEHSAVQLRQRGTLGGGRLVPAAGDTTHGHRLLRRLEPAAHLHGRGRIGVERIFFSRYADMLFEDRGALGDRHHHGLDLLGRLVRRVADFNVGIAVPEQIDLVQLQVGIGGGILPDAVHDGQPLVAVLEKADRAVDLLERFASGGDHQRQAGRGDFFHQRPVRQVAARHLQVVEAVLDNLVHRGLVPRRADGKKAVLDDGILEPPVVIPAQGGLGESLHELQVGPRPVVGMNEIGEMAVLELDGEAKVEAGTHFAHFADDAPPMGDVAHVVVGHLENEEHGG